jgi:hypothetical protein
MMAFERCPQLVTHICEELRFVLACLRELAALVLDFVKQPHIFHRDDGLVGEGRRQLNLSVGEWPHDGTREKDHAYRVSFAQQWNTERGADSGLSCPFQKRVFRIGQNIGNMNRLALENGASHHAPSRGRKRNDP